MNVVYEKTFFTPTMEPLSMVIPNNLHVIWCICRSLYATTLAKGNCANICSVLQVRAIWIRIKFCEFSKRCRCLIGWQPQHWIDCYISVVSIKTWQSMMTMILKRVGDPRLTNHQNGHFVSIALGILIAWLWLRPKNGSDSFFRTNSHTKNEATASAAKRFAF